MVFSTHCYIQNNGRWLMLHRNKKKEDVNKGKWIGIGGKIEQNETHEECILREIAEETGLKVTNLKYRGTVDFKDNEYREFMYLFTADSSSEEFSCCDEGELCWVNKQDVYGLSLWEGDRYFIDLILKDAPFFEMKLFYENSVLTKVQTLKTPLAVSACLLGENCKYNGQNNLNEEVLKLSEKYDIVPVCPEKSGGLEIPRPPAEIKNGSVFLKDGRDVTENFLSGSKISLDVAVQKGCKMAVLKANSPSCGCGRIYDGSFSKRLVNGDGITAALFKKNGIKVITEKEIDGIL